jgi:hypothetical protein
MKKLLILTTVLFSSITLSACKPTKEEKEDENTDIENIVLPYHTENWDKNIKALIDETTPGASDYIPAIPAKEYYCDYVKYLGNNATQISAYGVDAIGIEQYYLKALEDNDFYIYNGSYSDGTPHRYGYRLANPTDDLKVEYSLGSVDKTPVFSIVIYQQTNRIDFFPSDDYIYLFNENIPAVEAESYEAYFDNTYDSYMLFAHNTGSNGMDNYYQKVMATNKFELVSAFSSTESYYFTSLDGYTNIQFYEQYDEYNRSSLVVSVTTNSFRIATLRYLGSALPNFTETLDERTSFVVSSKTSNTFLVYFGPTTLEFFNSYCETLKSLGWENTYSQNSTYIGKTFTKGNVSFDCMFGEMQDTHEKTIVIAINIPEAN